MGDDNITYMIQTLNGFKQFILRGNVVDLAVGVVIGAAFSGVVEALVKDLFTPLIGVIVQVPDLSAKSFVINGSTFLYGDFLNHLVSFLLSAAAIYFFVVLPLTKFLNRHKAQEESKPVSPTEEVMLLREIRDSLQKRP